MVDPAKKPLCLLPSAGAMAWSCTGIVPRCWWWCEVQTGEPAPKGCQYALKKLTVLEDHAWPEIRRDYPLNLSILLSGGKETNKDSLSNGE